MQVSRGHRCLLYQVSSRPSRNAQVRVSHPLINHLPWSLTWQTIDSAALFNNSRRVSGSSQGIPATSDLSAVTESPRNLPPPTPELPPASSFDFPRLSPTQRSPSGGIGLPPHYPTAMTSTNPEFYARRGSTHVQPPETTAGPPPILSTSAPAWTSRDQTSMEPPPRRPRSDASEGNAPYRGVANQRPLPTHFAPALPPMDMQVAPTWQHHHYYPPANPPSYPQSQERYACPTCNKLFSRPSSLKIHTHSHTGEKPFKCNHQGCGKYFSVRSNMKRHEKGCHGASSSSDAGTSPE